MNYSLIIIAQYFENYSDNPEKIQNWKPKGSATFKVENVDRMAVYYSDKDLNKVVDELLSKRSNDHVKYELIELDWESEEPTIISLEEFNNILNN